MLYVVDDSTDYRFLIEQVFKLFLPMYPLRLFADGLELIQHVDQPTGAADNNPTGPSLYAPDLVRPGLIVLDIDMPKLTGFQTLERLKDYPLWQSIPVVMMSNRPEAGYREAAHELGAAAYISKPMGIPEMRDVMDQLCHRWLDA